MGWPDVQSPQATTGACRQPQDPGASRAADAAGGPAEETSNRARGVRVVRTTIALSTPRGPMIDAEAEMPNLPVARPRLPRPVRLRTSRTAVEPVAPPTVHREAITGSGLRWIHIERPTSADGDWLQAEFGFHALDLEDVFSRNQRSKLDTYDDYLFLVMQFPVFDKVRKRVIAVEMDLFIGPDYLVTLPNNELPPVQALFERFQEREELRDATFAKGSGYLLYEIIDRCVDASFPMLRKMGLRLDQLEDDIFEQERPSEVVRDLNDMKQEIISFRRIVRPQRAVLGDLEKTKQRYLAEEMEIYFDDISDAAERIWDILENYKEVIDSLDSTNETVLSHRVNDVLRLLTALSVVLLPGTLIASIFGMNVELPGDPDRAGLWYFWIILGVILLTILISLAWFRRRRFF
jgi:magnesium transporter